jgi:hypothetical protein
MLTYQVSSHFIRLPKGSTMSDLIEDMKSKVELSYSDAEFRLFEVYKNKIRKVYQPSEKISVNEFNGLLCVEEVPEEEKNAGVRDRLVHVCHFIIEKQVFIYLEPNVSILLVVIWYSLWFLIYNTIDFVLKLCPAIFIQLLS